MLSGSRWSTRKVVWGSRKVTHPSSTHIPKCPLSRLGHITTSSNTTMNRMPAQHGEAPRGASWAALGGVAETHTFCIKTSFTAWYPERALSGPDPLNIYRVLGLKPPCARMARLRAPYTSRNSRSLVNFCKPAPSRWARPYRSASDAPGGD
eukprot:1470159-Prymnesium_polylepis.1